MNNEFNEKNMESDRRATKKLWREAREFAVIALVLVAGVAILYLAFK